MSVNFPFYHQQDAMDCGPTCLRMIAACYGKNIPIDQLRASAGIGKEGVNLLGISEAAENLNFHTQGVQLSLEDLLQVKLPSILHWGQDHFVVLYKIKRHHYYIADPAAGLIKLKQQEFAQKWVSTNVAGGEQGIALLLEPNAGFYENDDDKEATENRGLTIFFRYLYPYKKLLIQLALGVLFGSLLQLVLPFLTQGIVDIGVNTRNISFLYLILAAQLALFTGRLLVDFIRGWLLYHISTRINIAILTSFLIKLLIV